MSTAEDGTAGDAEEQYEYDGYYYDEATGQWVEYVADEGEGEIELEENANESEWVPQPQQFNAAIPQGPLDSLNPAQNMDEARRLRDVLDKTYAFEDYEPHRMGWLADVSTEVFVSLGFKVYWGFFIFSGGTLIALLMIHWLFSIMFRVFKPPSESNSSYIQSLGLFCTFIAMSIATVAVICCCFDFIKIFFGTTRDDCVTWGISHSHFPTLAQLCCRMIDDGEEVLQKRRERQRIASADLKNTPPWLLYVVVNCSILIFAPLYALLRTVTSNNNTIFHFVQELFFITTVVSMCIICIVYFWFFLRSFRQKTAAYERRNAIEDFRTNQSVPKDNWYRSEEVLEELGLDGRTLRWSVVAIPAGICPLLGINVAMATDGTDETPNAGWVATALLFFCCLLLIQQLAESKRRHRAVYVTIFLMFLFTLIGIIGTALTGSSSAISVFILPLIATHWLLIRKRNHSLSRKEICALMEITIERQEDQVVQDKRLDTFLCTGRNTLFACFSCLDIHAIFGYRHPRVCQRERQLRRERVCIRSDYKTMLGLWGFVAIFYFTIMMIGRASVERYDSTISTISSGNSITGKERKNYCDVELGSVGMTKLTIVDFAMLAALSHSFGRDHDIDFATWFGHIPSLKRVFPSTLFFSEEPLAWEHFQDFDKGLNIVVVRSSNTGYRWAQHVDAWGESLFFHAASVLIPHLNIWPENSKKLFLSGAATVKRALDNDWLPTANLEAYIKRIRTNNTFVVGAGFAGGYAKMIAKRVGDIRVVTFNSPNTELSASVFDGSKNSIGVDVVTSSSVVGHIGGLSDSTVFNVDCVSASAIGCSKTLPILASLHTTCGDLYGRQLNYHD